MLRVGFDGRDLLRQRTGVVNNAVHLARLLADRTDGALIVYADTFVDAAVRPPDEVPLKRLTAPPIVWKHLALPLALLRDRVDVFHSPTSTLPLLAPCRQLVTMHDLFAAVEPAWFPSQRAAAQLRDHVEPAPPEHGLRVRGTAPLAPAAGIHVRELEADDPHAGGGDPRRHLLHERRIHRAARSVGQDERYRRVLGAVRQELDRRHRYVQSGLGKLRLSSHQAIEPAGVLAGDLVDVVAREVGELLLDVLG